MTFLLLTSQNGKRVRVRAEAIDAYALSPDGKSTLLWLRGQGDEFQITDSPDYLDKYLDIVEITK